MWYLFRSWTMSEKGCTSTMPALGLRNVSLRPKTDATTTTRNGVTVFLGASFMDALLHSLTHTFTPVHAPPHT